MADGQAILDVNYTPALSQLYASKVNHFIGGLIDFDTFRRNNPHWPKIIPPFIYQSLLDNLKKGDNISIRELIETKEKVGNLVIAIYFFAFNHDNNNGFLHRLLTNFLWNSKKVTKPKIDFTYLILVNKNVFLQVDFPEI